MGLLNIFKQVKWARRVAIAAVVLLFLGVFGGVLLVLNLNRVVKTGIERGGSVVMGIPITVEEVDVSLFGGTAEVRNLTMGSPEGYEEDMLTLKRGYVEMEFTSLLGETIVIHNVELEEPDVMFEFGGAEGNNWKTLMARLKTTEKEEAKRPVSIDRIVVEGTKLRVAGGGLLTDNPLVRDRSLSLPALQVNEFATGEDNTLTIAEALYDLFRDLLGQMSAKLDDLQSDPGDTMDNIREEAGGLLNGL